MSYQPPLDLKQTERAIRMIKEFFQTNLAEALNLLRVSAPLFVAADTGVNDNLNGTERPVSFPIKALNDRRAEIVQSLAKWKRMALADYGFEPDPLLPQEFVQVERLQIRVDACGFHDLVRQSRDVVA